MRIKGKQQRFNQAVCLFALLLFSWYMPSSGSIFFGKLFRRLRYSCCKRNFLFCGKKINIERGDFFASGTRFPLEKILVFPLTVTFRWIYGLGPM